MCTYDICLFLPTPWLVFSCVNLFQSLLYRFNVGCMCLTLRELVAVVKIYSEHKGRGCSKQKFEPRKKNLLLSIILVVQQGSLKWFIIIRPYLGSTIPYEPWTTKVFCIPHLFCRFLTKGCQPASWCMSCFQGWLCETPWKFHPHWQPWHPLVAFIGLLQHHLLSPWSSPKFQVRCPMEVNSLPETNSKSPWKMMVGRQAFPFGFWPIFGGANC